MTPQLPIYGKGGVVRTYALLDQADYDRLSRWRWKLQKNGYVTRWDGTSTIYLHREVLELAPGDQREGDHKNRNRLDNRRSNLRLATHALNGQNLSPRRGCTSRFRGVSWDKERGLWHVQIGILGKNHHVGRFADEMEAARAASAFRAQHMPFAVEEVAA